MHRMLYCVFLLSWATSSLATIDLFVDLSEDPFMDPFIETIAHMNTKDILAMPKMSDSEFQYYLTHDEDTHFGASPRVDTSIFDQLRDDQLKQQDDIDKEWETLMVSGPIVVGYMGNLMVLASKKDFPFQAPTSYVYRYIRYPNSFRATLAQVSTDMYNALMGAHTSMDQIQLAIKQVPTHVKTAMKLITSASNAMLKSMLPRTLETISRLATESANYANSTLVRFNQLQDLLSEIIELSANTQSGNEAEIDRMNEQKVNSTLEQERLKQSLQAIQNQYTDSKNKLEAARRQYNEAMQELSQSSSPQILESGGGKPGFFGMVIGLYLDPLKTIGCILGSCGNPTITVDNTKFENAMKIAQLAKEELERAEQLHNEHFQLQLVEQNELAKTMNKMALLDLSKLSTEEIIRLLLEATEQISQIKEQWSRMIQFFFKLAAQAQSTQQVVVKDFVEVIQQAQTDNLLVDPIDREFFLEILVPSATSIESGAHLLFVMAKTYYAVSKEHMIDQIAGIGKLLILQTDDARTLHLQQASNTTLITSMKISKLAQERHEMYLQETGNRQAEYTAYINSLMTMELERIVG